MDGHLANGGSASDSKYTKLQSKKNSAKAGTQMMDMIITGISNIANDANYYTFNSNNVNSSSLEMFSASKNSDGTTTFTINYISGAGDGYLFHELYHGTEAVLGTLVPDWTKAIGGKTTQYLHPGSSYLSSEKVAYQIQFMLQPNTLPGNGQMQKIKTFMDVTRGYLRTIKDKSGNLVYPNI
tara:strand:- start:900 stop:1445 length:546 start_codon:yes stop_codon:yes gene_type:complete